MTGARPEPRPDAIDPTTTPTRRGLADQVFVVSAAMVGVSLTLLGLVSVVASVAQSASLAEELLAINALGFLVACLSAYLALRTESPARARTLERFADGAFIASMVALVALGGVVALGLA